MYYGLIILSVVLFGGCFALNDAYRKRRGSSFKVSLQFSLETSGAGLAALLALNGFRLEYTPFSLGMALLAALNGFGFSYCGLRALGTINLSLYSLFSMLGGMVFPFLQGVLFYGEKLTAAKVVCLALICLALLLTVEKGEKKKKGGIYYAGIFTLNGLSGVLSKVFASADYEKTSAAGYSILIALCTVVLSGAVLLVFSGKLGEAPKPTLGTVGLGLVNGAGNKVANFLLVAALAHVEASVQYPMVTGGVMIVSTLICCFGPNKPSKREIGSVALAFAGMLALFAIPG